MTRGGPFSLFEVEAMAGAKDRLSSDTSFSTAVCTVVSRPVPHGQDIDGHGAFSPESPQALSPQFAARRGIFRSCTVEDLWIQQRHTRLLLSAVSTA